MSAAILDRRPGNIVETLHDGRHVSVEQDVTDIIELCRHLRSADDRFRGFRRPGEFRHVASIPLALVEIERARGRDLLRDPEAMRAFLNEPECAPFRVSAGSV